MFLLLQKKIKDLEISHSNNAWVKEKENLKNNLNENLKEIKSLNKQCNQYTELIEKLQKDVSKIKIKVSIYL